MSIKKTATIQIAKILIFLLRLLNSGGTNLPGKLALKVYPKLLSILAQEIKIVFITGTNGKTTTTKILSDILDQNGIPYITNKAGANLTTGIYTTLLAASDRKGRIDTEFGIFEIDEAAFWNISDYIKPYMVVVTNFFRDQLDRYGELYTTVKKVKEGIRKNKDSICIINADDSLSVYLGHDISNKVIFYGIDTDVPFGNTSRQSDAPYCIICKSRYEYKKKIYGHLGHFVCPNCGYERPEADIAVNEIGKLDMDFSEIQITDNINEKVGQNVKINLPGIYNIYNSICAFAAGSVLKMDNEKMLKSLASFSNSFGRMEKIKIKNKTIKLILVKNPTGFNQVLSYLVRQEKSFSMALLLNDNIADGTDISWIWDVDFEILDDIQSNIDTIYASGIRAEDMALRLKYAGVFTSKIQVLKDYQRLIEDGLKALKPDGTLYILPTYTSMLDIRKMLCRKYNLKEFWE